MQGDPIDDPAEEIEATPSDEFLPVGPGRRRLRLAPLATALRFLSALALLFAVASVIAILAIDAAHLAHPQLTWRIKSALPLIAIGLSYALLQFTLPRTLTEFLLSLSVSLGFILWGAEQYIPAPQVASFVDHLVAFLFVMDLGLVIRARLKHAPPPPDSGIDS
jgi:hypothetical protein